MKLLVTLLTGRRPDLLQRTLAAVADHQPELLQADWLVLHNGADRDTAAVLKAAALPSVVDTSKLFLNIGQATTRLFAQAVEADADFLLHLEDDWEAGPGPVLPRAVELLDDVFQIRLRRASERVLQRHMVTTRVIPWRPAVGARVASEAHYTLNPSLIRLQDLRFGFPASSERDAQRNFHRAGKRRVAQLIPGVFAHIGASRSLH